MSSNFFLLGINKVFGIYAEVFTEANNVNAFAVLRYAEVHGIYNLRWNYGIAYFVKSIEDSFKRFAFIVNCKSFYIFKEKCFWLLATKYFCYIEEKSATGFLEAEAFTCEGKCLTREAGTKNIKVIRDKTLGILRSYIAKRDFAIVGKISFLSLCIPLGGKYTLTPEILEGHAKTSNAGKKVDECEFGVFRSGKRNEVQIIKKGTLKRCQWLTSDRAIQFYFARQSRISPSINELLGFSLIDSPMRSVFEHEGMGNDC